MKEKDIKELVEGLLQSALAAGVVAARKGANDKKATQLRKLAASYAVVISEALRASTFDLNKSAESK